MFKQCAFSLLRTQPLRVFLPTLKHLTRRQPKFFTLNSIFFNSTRQCSSSTYKLPYKFEDIEHTILTSLPTPVAELERQITTFFQAYTKDPQTPCPKPLTEAFSTVSDKMQDLDIWILAQTLLEATDTAYLNYSKETVQCLKVILLYDFLQEYEYTPHETRMVLHLLCAFALKMSEPSNIGMIDYCNTQLRASVESAMNSDAIHREVDVYKVQKLFLIYLKNRAFLSAQSVKAMNKYIVAQLYTNVGFEEYKFLSEIVTRIALNPIAKNIDETQLLSNETPFDTVLESSKSLGDRSSEVIQGDMSTNILAAVHDIIKRHITSDSREMTFDDLRLCLKIFGTTRLDFKESIERLIKRLQINLGLHMTSKTSFPIDYNTLLEVFMEVISEMRPNTAFYRELLKESLQLTYKAIDEVPSLTIQQCNQIYSIFRYTQTVYPPLLDKIRDILHPNLSKLDLTSFLNIFYFYSSLPASLSEYTISERELNMYIRQNFRKLQFGTIMDIAIASIQMGFDGQVSSTDSLPTLDSDLWSRIFELMMQTRAQNLNIKEKAKFFRCLKILALIIEQNVFNYSLIEEKLKALNSARVSFDSIESAFQQEVEACLKNLSKVYEKEKMIEDVLSIDFLVPKKIVLEVNGPSHYFIVFDEGKGSYHENGSTALKRKLLQMLKYRYSAVAFYEWFGIESTFDKENHVIYLLSRDHDVY